MFVPPRNHLTSKFGEAPAPRTLKSSVTVPSFWTRTTNFRVTPRARPRSVNVWPAPLRLIRSLPKNVAAEDRRTWASGCSSLPAAVS